MRARSRQRHAPLSPARRRLRPRGPHSSPGGRPHAGPGARAAALLAAGPRAMPPGGWSTRTAAHGRVPTRPGKPRRPCRRAGPGGSGETPAPRRSSSSGPRAGCTGAPGELEAADAGSEPLSGRRPLESVHRRTRPPPGRGHAEPAGRGPRARAEAGFQAAPRSVRVAPGEATRPAPAQD